jgi:Bacterial Ig domain
MNSAVVRTLLVVGVVLTTMAGFAAKAPAIGGGGSWVLTVGKSGNGYVSGSGTGWSIDCGTTCSASIPATCAYDPSVGQVVCDSNPATITAANANGFNFSSWSGCTTVSGNNCTVDTAADTTATANFTDVEAPTVSLTSPASSQIKYGTFTLAATASDNSGTISKVEFYVRGTKVGTATSAPFQVSFNSAAVADGSALIEARSFDPTGNMSSASSATVTIDNLPPALSSISGPGAGPFGPGTTQSFTWTASDLGSGVQSVQCKLDSGAYGACTSSTSVSYSNLGNGSHTLTVLVTDNANRTTSKWTTWSIDAQGPATAFTQPSGGSAVRGITTLGVDASDSASVARVEFWRNGAKFDQDTSAPYSTSFDTTQVADGSATFTAKAFDGFGNETDVPLTVTVDNTRPTVSFASGPDGQTFAGGTTQTWTFNSGDAASGIASISCKVDDGTFAPCSGGDSETVSNAASGSHTLTVRAVDNAGNDQTATRNWSIDATGPVAQITSGPTDGATTSETTLTFGFSADEPATFQCRVYPAALTPPGFAPCSGTGTHTAAGFSPGTYTFEVVATDAYGNVGSSLKRTFTVAPSAGTGPGSGSGSDGAPSGSGAPAIAAKLASKWSVKGGRTKIALLKLSGLPATAAIKLTCKGKGCAFRSRAVSSRARIADLTKLFKKKTLAAGSKVTITITSAGMRGEQITLATQKRGRPKQTVRRLG